MSGHSKAGHTNHRPVSDKIVTVFGGSGFLGRNIVRELAAAGWRVRVAVRRPNTAHFLLPMGAVGQIQLFQANVRDDASVARALKGADAVVNLVGILYQSGKQTFDAVQAGGAARIAKLAAEQGITDFIHMSAIGADPDSPSTYGKTKAAGEAAVREHMPTAAIMRPSVVFGPEDGFFNLFAGMSRFAPVLPLFGGGAMKLQPVHVDDVADAVLAALADETSRGRIFELGGPRVMTFKDCMELMLQVVERKRLLLPLPMAAAYMIGFFGQLLPKPPLTVDQVRLLEIDNVVSGEHGALADLGIEPTDASIILPTYLVRYRKHGQFDSSLTG